MKRKPWTRQEIVARYVDLSGINLLGHDLTGIDLHLANLSNANLRAASLSGADLRNTNLSGADLSEANLSGANLTGTRFNINTTLPDGTKWSEGVYIRAI